MIHVGMAKVSAGTETNGAPIAMCARAFEPTINLEDQLHISENSFHECDLKVAFSNYKLWFSSNELLRNIGRSEFCGYHSAVE